MNKTLLHTCILLFTVVLLLLTRNYWQGSLAEYLIAVAGILIAGIPHGAMDHLTASFIEKEKFKLIRYLLQYILSALIYLLVWLFAPGIALLLFLLLTAWHFGETDMLSFSNKQTSPLIIFIYGSCLLMWLLLKDPSVTLQWIQLVAGNQGAAVAIMNILKQIPHLLWFVVSAVLLFSSVFKQRDQWMSVFVFLLFMYTTVYTSLILGFILYFTGWHSVQALQHIRFSVFKQAGIKKLLFNAVPATLGSVVLLLLIMKYGKAEWMQSSSLPSLFILLSVLTLPHMAEMHRLYKWKLTASKEGG
ncbi:MAG: Brp/Blh family beta-carotene 15,15'-dioxygenase [Chitinophagaceae bacterium]|jgi:beta-carotene 15,15'-dioxygenase|nr:Brp/Blh family beta-carotene 15,15'-dioxygenase [Chitinophagaceae bacterium]